MSDLVVGRFCGFCRYVATDWLWAAGFWLLAGNACWWILQICRYIATITTAGGGCATGLEEVATGLGEMAGPAFLEIFLVVAFDYGVWAGAVVAGADAERFQQAGHLFGFHGLVFAPFVPSAVRACEHLRPADPGALHHL